MAGYIGSKASVVSSGAERKKTFDITTSTTSLTGLSYTVGQVHVFHNGVRLVDGTDYTATNSTSITLTAAAENGDQVVVVSYATFQVADAYTKTEADAEFVAKAGDTMTGGLTVGGSFTSLGIDDNATSTAVTIDASGRVTMPYQPAFMAYSSTFTASGFYPFTSFNLPFTGGFNQGNHFNLSTGVFTAPVSGLYQINYTFHDSLNTTNRKIGRIYLNNISVGYGEMAEATSTYSDVGGAVVLNLSANDAIQWATHPLNWGSCTASAFLIG
jgi:hypothetical protein